uniref:Uncharacterized protein n=1 Tax=Arundo donax TaxID=35708 RepID=A0A0A9G9R6_ARUDO
MDQDPRHLHKHPLQHNIHPLQEVHPLAISEPEEIWELFLLLPRRPQGHQRYPLVLASSWTCCCTPDADHHKH